MIRLVRAGPVAGQRQRYTVAVAEELARYERPMPAMEEYDLLLSPAPGGIQ